MLSDDDKDFIIIGGPRPKTKREFLAYVWLGAVATITLVVIKVFLALRNIAGNDLL